MSEGPLLHVLYIHRKCVSLTPSDPLVQNYSFLLQNYSDQTFSLYFSLHSPNLWRYFFLFFFFADGTDSQALTGILSQRKQSKVNFLVSSGKKTLILVFTVCPTCSRSLSVTQ